MDPADAEADPRRRRRSESVSGKASPPRAITIPFSSRPSWKLSTIASSVGDSASAACTCASSSSCDST